MVVVGNISRCLRCKCEGAFFSITPEQPVTSARIVRICTFFSFPYCRQLGQWPPRILALGFAYELNLPLLFWEVAAHLSMI